MDSVHNALLFTGWTKLTRLENQNEGNRGKEVFIANFNIEDISAVSVRWVEYFGTTSDDESYSVDSDENGNVYVVGFAGRSNYTTLYPIFTGLRSSFLIAFNSTGIPSLDLCNQ